MKIFRILFAFDSLALLVLVYFFADGLRSASNPDYIDTWLPLLLIPAAALALARVLQGKGRTGWARLLLGLLAAPFLFYLLFAGLFIALAPDMK